MITFSDVSFTYTGDSYVLQDLNLTIEKGQFVCVLGANGSGKSTFSKLINALLLPDKGTVTTKGMDTSGYLNIPSLSEVLRVRFFKIQMISSLLASLKTMLPSAPKT